MKRFGVMLDMSRNAVMKPDEVKNLAKILKDMGYNMIQLYTEDTYEVENEPYFGYMRGRYSIAEMQDIVAYCNSIGVEVIPCIQTLAHLNQIFRWPAYQPINDFADILMVDEPRTYEFIENMFKTVRKCFTSDYIHIGMDEAHMLGLGKFLDKNGPQNRFEILCRHLAKVVEIAEKYNFKPIMWSDMFFRLGNKGEYCLLDPVLSDDVIAITPKNVGLVFWDYYHDYQKMYDCMISAHKRFDNEIWFAGGAWTWTGFTGGNKYTLETMIPAMHACREQNIENILMTMWGDNGKECSFYSLLPSLYAVRRAYDGVTDEQTIKAEFKAITGEDYDEMSALDIPNYVGGNQSVVGNVSKYMLYNDLFMGLLDTTVKDGVTAEYVKHAETLAGYAKNSKNFGYLFESASALCNVLSTKYDLGVRTRNAYNAKDKTALTALVDEYSVLLEKLENFYDKFSTLWYKENKPQGFEIQDHRFGGLMLRIKACQKRLKQYLNGELETLEELDEKLLDFLGGGDKFDNEKTPIYNGWLWTISANIV